jgi:hypothetical protein
MQDYGCVNVQQFDGYTVFKFRTWPVNRMSSTGFLGRSFPTQTGDTVETTQVTQRIGTDWPDYIEQAGLATPPEIEFTRKKKLAVEQLRGDVSDRCFNFRLNIPGDS